MRALSLEYHDVIAPESPDESGFPGAGPASYKLSRVNFSRHLEAIASRLPQPAGRVTDWLAAPQAAVPLFLTFDDGGVSAHAVIADALEQRGWRGHFFVTAGRVGMSTFVSPSQIRELRDRGHLIGSHSVLASGTHGRLLPRPTAGGVEAEHRNAGRNSGTAGPDGVGAWRLLHPSGGGDSR